jgi:DNA-directed RNA polymerase specialized sigma24 family protein
MAKVTPPSAEALEALLLKAQQGDGVSETELYTTCVDWVFQMAKTRCARLGVDPNEVEAVVQETFTRLLDPKRQRYDKYLSKRVKRMGGMSRRRNSAYGPPHDYIGGVVWNVIGFGKRRRRAEFERNEGFMSPVLLEADGGELAEQAMLEGPGSQAGMEAYVAAREVLAAVPPLTRTLALAVYCGDKMGTEVAEELGISKFRVSREIKKFRETGRLMLVA